MRDLRDATVAIRFVERVAPVPSLLSENDLPQLGLAAGVDGYGLKNR